jgi:hypothetical protein
LIFDHDRGVQRFYGQPEAVASVESDPRRAGRSIY